MTLAAQLSIVPCAAPRVSPGLVNEVLKSAMMATRDSSGRFRRRLAALVLAVLVLGAFAWLAGVASGHLSPQSFYLLLAADLVGWFPLLYYLLRDLPYRRTLVAWASVACHVAACLTLLAAGQGTEIEPEMAARQLWIAAHVPLWVTAWTTWAVASLSLLAFCRVWADQLRERGASVKFARVAWLTVWVGLLFDLAGESVNVMWLTLPGIPLGDFSRGAQLYTILSAATANGLYCVGGLQLSAAAWRIGWLAAGSACSGSSCGASEWGLLLRPFSTVGSAWWSRGAA